MPSHGKAPDHGKKCFSLAHSYEPLVPTQYQSKRFFVPSENRFVKLRVSTKGIKIINKRGIESVLAEMRARGEKF